MAALIPEGESPLSLREIRKLNPARQRVVLRELILSRLVHRDTIKEHRKRLKRLLKELHRLEEDAPTSTWIRDVDVDGVQFPPGKNDPPTPHGVRMVMSVVSGRYTPPQALAVEDFLDGMRAARAEFYQYPASPSADAIRRIADAKARPVDGW